MRPSARTDGSVVGSCGLAVVVAVLVWLPGARPAVATTAAVPPPRATGGAVPAAVATVEARPVPGPVVRGFDEPTRYGPGHRGVDLLAVPGTRVRAPAAGRVAFAGRVVGSSWVTVDDGRHRWTVGPLRMVSVARGDVVAAGTPVGTSAPAHGAAALHLSARTADRYVEPVLPARPRVSLVPLPEAAGPAPDPAPAADPGVRSAARTTARSSARPRPSRVR